MDTRMQSEELKTDELPVPRIEVYQYLGYHGTFARERKLLWRCDIVNFSGKREFAGSWMSEGYGTLEKDYAEQYAAEWKDRTGWPVFDLGRQEARDDKPRG